MRRCGVLGLLLALVCFAGVISRVRADALPFAVYLPNVSNPYQIPPTYFDDFSDPSSGWPTSPVTDISGKLVATRAYVNGTYQILAPQGGSMFQADHNDQAGDFVAEMDVWNASNALGTNGFFFGWSSTTGFYDFEVGNGWFSLEKVDYVAGTTVIFNPTLSSAINPGNQRNHLKVTRTGSQIILYANNVRLGEVYDSTFGAGSVGLVASGGPGFDARFDNLALWTTGPTPTPPAATPTPVPLPDSQAVAYQIDPAHDGYTTMNLALPLTRTWSVNLRGNVSYPLIAQGRVYVTVSNTSAYGYTYPGSQLYALDIGTGQIDWGPIALVSTSLWSHAAYDNGSLFVVTGDGLLQSFDPATGGLRWSTQLPGIYLDLAFSSPPTARGGLVYVGASSGMGENPSVYAVDENTGAVRWISYVLSGMDSSPAVTADGAYVSYACMQVYKFDPATGATDWTYSGPCEGGGGTTPVFSNGRLYVRDWGSSNGYVFDARSGSVLSRFSAGPMPALSPTMAYFLNNSVLTATNLANGAAAWTFTGDGTLVSSPVVLNGIVYIGGSSGNLYALDGNSGTELWSTNVGASISPPEQGAPSTGLGAGEGTLVVPAGNLLVAYSSGVTATGSASRAVRATPRPTGTPTPTKTTGVVQTSSATAGLTPTAIIARTVAETHPPIDDATARP